MPVLARHLEAAGFATVFVTNMPFWLQWTPVPRALAVEHPFGHLLGRPGDPLGQLEILRQALVLLASAAVPGALEHSPSLWPQETAEANAAWQPASPSPVVQLMAPKLRELIAQRRRRA